MLRNELNYLIKQKSREGKSSKEISNEIVSLIESQELFKHSNKKINLLEKRLEKAGNKIEKLREQLAKKDKQIFDLKHQVNITKTIKPKKEKESNGNTKTANVFQLKRMLILLKDEGKPMTKNKIFKSCGMSSGQGETGLSFLLRHNLIKKSGAYYECYWLEWTI